MSTNLKRIGEKARQCPGLVFTSLYHHVTDIDNLRASYNSLEGSKAPGFDGMTKEKYGENLEENLRVLSGKLKRMGYIPKPKRRTYVPKPGSDKKRPLGISCFEDKIVEEAVKQVLEPIYETVFDNCSFGYRPERKQHDCVDALGITIQQRKVSYVVEADIRGFFDNVNHEWLLKFLRLRIRDERIVRLIHRMLKSGILEDGLVRASESGTPQGSIISPLLSNIYLHYVLDSWFSVKVKRGCKGEAYLFRYADDFVACFQFKREAEMRRLSTSCHANSIQMDKQEEPEKSIHMARVQPGSHLYRVAEGKGPCKDVPFREKCLYLNVWTGSRIRESLSSGSERARGTTSVWLSN
jgi:group II intron reverse transcriptase/maturase